MEIPDVELYEMLCALPKKAWVSSDGSRAWIAMENGCLVVIPETTNYLRPGGMWATVRAIQDC